MLNLISDMDGENVNDLLMLSSHRRIFVTYYNVLDRHIVVKGDLYSIGLI